MGRGERASGFGQHGNKHVALSHGSTAAWTERHCLSSPIFVGSGTFDVDLDGWPGKPGEIERGARPDSGEVVVQPALGSAAPEVTEPPQGIPADIQRAA